MREILRERNKKKKLTVPDPQSKKNKDKLSGLVGESLRAGKFAKAGNIGVL